MRSCASAPPALDSRARTSPSLGTQVLKFIEEGLLRGRVGLRPELLVLRLRDGGVPMSLQLLGVVQDQSVRSGHDEGPHHLILIVLKWVVSDKRSNNSSHDRSLLKKGYYTIYISGSLLADLLQIK